MHRTRFVWGFFADFVAEKGKQSKWLIHIEYKCVKQVLGTSNLIFLSARAGADKEKSFPLCWRTELEEDYKLL